MASQPQQAYDVKLDIFEGPLDLLLFLIKKDNLDIYDIPISQITREFLAYVDVMKDLDLDFAGDFLVMAASLMQIKARVLLPKEEKEEDEGPDPRDELVSKLLEYKKYKEAAHYLEARMHKMKDVYYRGAPTFPTDDLRLEASLFSLMSAFQDVLNKAGEEIQEFLYEEIPVEQKIREILDQLDRTNKVKFKELFKESASRKIIIVTFLAILELIRTHMIAAWQVQSYGEIWIEKTDFKKGMENESQESH